MKTSPSAPWNSQNSAKNKTPVTIILQEKNKGKGAAIRSAFKVAENDIITIQDADLEYNPADFKKFEKKLSKNFKFKMIKNKYYNGNLFNKQDHYFLIGKKL